MVEEKEVAVVVWAFNHGNAAGYDTDILRGSAFRFIPIKSQTGVLGVCLSEESDVLFPDTSRVLETFADLAGLAMR